MKTSPVTPSPLTPKLFPRFVDPRVSWEAPNDIPTRNAIMASWKLAATIALDPLWVGLPGFVRNYALASQPAFRVKPGGESHLVPNRSVGSVGPEPLPTIYPRRLLAGGTPAPQWSMAFFSVGLREDCGARVSRAGGSLRVTKASKCQLPCCWGGGVSDPDLTPIRVIEENGPS